MTGGILVDRELWFYMIVLAASVGLIWGLRDTRRVIEAPFLYAFGMSILMIPQYFVTVIDPSRVPDEAFLVYSMMIMLCSALFYWGYFGANKRPRGRSRLRSRHVIDADRLFSYGLVVAMIGTVGSLQLQSFGEIDEWRGWPVYWYTLSKFTLPGVTMILISYAQSRKFIFLVAALLLSIFPFLTVLDAGRRSMTMMLPVIYLLPIMIYNVRWKPPRFAIVVFMALAFVIVYAFPYWRGEFAGRRYLAVVAEYPISFIMTDIFSAGSGKTLETIDSMILTGAHFSLDYYEWGMTLYNQLVQNYVPRGLVGSEFKDSLRWGSGIGLGWTAEVYGIEVAYYTGKSAYSEVFGQFGFLGSAVFFFIGRVFRLVRDAIVTSGDGRAIIFLCFFIQVPASLAWSQFLLGLVLSLPNIFVMLLAFRFCVRKVERLPRPMTRRRAIDTARKQGALRHGFG